jgi:hypothetical protein
MRCFVKFNQINLGDLFVLVMGNLLNHVLQILEFQIQIANT